MQGQHRHMITGKLSVSQANSPEDGLLFRDNSSLFPDFAFSGIKDCLAPFHPATGQKPARPVGMLNQQNPVFRVKNRGSGAQRKAPRLSVDRLQGNL
jgi:hypothetical protein